MVEAFGGLSFTATRQFLKIGVEKKAIKHPSFELFELLLFNSRFVGFVFLSTFDELRIYKAELEHMNSF